MSGYARSLGLAGCAVVGLLGCARASSSEARDTREVPAASVAAVEQAPVVASVAAPASAAADAWLAPPVARPVAPRVAPRLTLRVPMEKASIFDWDVTAEGLPALAEGGRVVALLFAQDDGLRGLPNRSLVLVDVEHDRALRTMDLIVAQELSAPSEKPTPRAPLEKKYAALATQVTARVAEAQAFLDGKSWSALATAESADIGSDHPLTVDGVLVSIAASHLRVVVPPQPMPLFDRALPSAGELGLPCRYEPRLWKAAFDAKARVLAIVVVEVEVAGGDWCNAPSSFHAYRLP